MSRGVSSPFNLDLRRGILNGLKILRAKLEVYCADVFFKTMQLRRTRYRNDPRFFSQDPRKRNLCGRGLLFCGEVLKEFNQGRIRLAILRGKTGHGTSKVGTIKLRV